ncbi:hypothetical protein D3C85_480690 [compost metagenome]
MAFFAASAIQRAVEGVFGATMATGHGFTSAFRKLDGAGMAKRYRSIKDGIRYGETHRAWGENKEFWADWKGKFNRAGVLGKSYLGAESVARVGLTGLDMGVAAAADVLKLGVGTAATAAGMAARVGVLGVTKPLGYATRAAFTAGGGALGKTGKALGKTAGNLAIHGSIGLGRDTIRAGAGIAGAVWHTRKNPVVNTLLAGGAITGGLAYGSSKPEMRASLGVMSAATPSYMEANPGAAFPGQPFYENMKPNRRLDTMGASGDLVFALNNLRGGGVL